MKNKLSLFIIIILSSFIMTSCYSDLDLEEYRTMPIVVLNSAISPDTIVMASISRTWFFTENNPNVNLQSAQVELYINGSFTEQMQWRETAVSDELNSNGLYVSTIIPRSGDVVKILATTKFGMVWAEDTVPASVAIEDVKYTVRSIPGNGSTISGSGGITTEVTFVEIKYEITFQENPKLNDYYLIKVTGPDHIDFSFDPVFTDNESVLDGSLGKNIFYDGNSRVFTDETINGKKYTLKLVERYGNLYDSETTMQRKISLYKLSKSYYQYIYSIQNISEERLMTNMVEFGLAEPMRIFSNVQGGTGILGASQRSDTLVYINNLPTN